MARLYAYVYGFNFYYGAVKNTPYKWLDFGKLCRTLFPRHEIGQIRYFTSLVAVREKDPQQRLRQEVYLRALQTVPNLSIHYGQFQDNTIYRPLANAPPDFDNLVAVLDTREKASDVNLASYLLMDAFKGSFDVAVVFSNDSDLATPIRLAVTKLGKEIGVYGTRRRVTHRLSEFAAWTRSLRQGPLRASQFPDRIIDADGRTITKPASW